MASVLSHPAVPLALAAALGPRTVPPALAAAACVASVLPDADVVGFFAGVPYDHLFGHRGFTHSLFFALLVASVGALSFRSLSAASPGMTFAVLFLAAASHGVLDAMTTGGLGVAFWSPFSNARYFLPWRVIRVSPIGVSGFLSHRGLEVLRSELRWIWIPAALLAGLGAGLRRWLTP